MKGEIVVHENLSKINNRSSNFYKKFYKYIRISSIYYKYHSNSKKKSLINVYMRFLSPLINKNDR
jgi:hypothetical protein